MGEGGQSDMGDMHKLIYLFSPLTFAHRYSTCGHDLAILNDPGSFPRKNMLPGKELLPHNYHGRSLVESGIVPPQRITVERC